MPSSVADFVTAANDSGVLAADSLAEYMQDVLPNADATSLASRLVKDGRLTAFQAKYIYSGKANSLVLGPYIILDMLGKGGMGYVYKAEHRKMQRIVALKVIAKAGLKNPNALRRFEREVQAAAMLIHPNIVTAHDAGVAAGTHYLAMQFIEGRTLSQVVKELGPQQVRRAVNWILQAARGLQFAHENGVIHRDIKPSNLLVDSEGTVKILDMGLARLETLGADQDQLTGTGQIMGTVDYMPPEQAVDTRQADARSDIYALGVTLWYLLAGRPLFEADSVVGKIMAHQQKPASPLTDASKEVSPLLDTVFQRMVAKQPADRFQSMAEVIEALESVQQGSSAPEPPSLDFNSSPWWGRPPASEPPHMFEQPSVAVGNDHTVRLHSFNAETNFGVRRVSRSPRQRKSARKPVHLATGIGLVSAMLVIGLLLFGPGLGKNKQQGSRAEVSRDASVTSPGSQLDAATRGTVAEPTESALPAPTPQPHTTAAPDLSGSATSARPPSAVVPFDAEQARVYQAAWAKHLGIAGEWTNSIGATLVVIPPGQFMMGDNTVEVTLTKPFMLGQTEVTQGQWKEVMGTAPWDGKEYVIQGTDVAATFISWFDASEFCMQLTERERGMGLIGSEHIYRLPTEAEWEFACRAGTTTAFSFGDDAALIEDYAWFGGGWNYETLAPTPGGNTASEMYAHAVKLKKPNPWGLFDMHGNASEWCRDWQADYPSGPVKDPQGPSQGDRIIFRGGGWLNLAKDCGSTAPASQVPSFFSVKTGLRVVLAETEDTWLAEVRMLPVAVQIYAVSERMKAVNAGFDGRLGEIISEGQVTSINLSANVNPSGRFVRDISPLRAFQSLRKLWLESTAVNDLSPVRELPLSDLHIGYTKVTSLEHVRDMPLEILNCWGTRIADLSPLQGKQVVSLALNSCPIVDLTPLAGMPLRAIGLKDTLVRSLEPLADAPLEELWIDRVPITDLSPLKKAPLKSIVCDETLATSHLAMLRELGCKVNGKNPDDL